MARLEPVKMSSSGRQSSDERTEIDMKTDDLNRSRPAVVMTFIRGAQHGGARTTKNWRPSQLTTIGQRPNLRS